MLVVYPETYKYRFYSSLVYSRITVVPHSIHGSTVQPPHQSPTWVKQYASTRCLHFHKEPLVTSVHAISLGSGTVRMTVERISSPTNCTPSRDIVLFSLWGNRQILPYHENISESADMLNYFD